MEQIAIEPAKQSDIPKAAFLLSRAFLPTPIIATVFQGTEERKRRSVEAFFKSAISGTRGRLLVARDNNEIVGVMGIADCPRPRPTTLKRLLRLPINIMTSRSDIARFRRTMATWAKYDPKEPHCHFGPFAVLPERQGQGVGSRLLKHLCQHVDQRDQPCYLETETYKNVLIYEHFGFSVIREVPVLGLPTWMMWRPSRSDRPS